MWKQNYYGKIWTIGLLVVWIFMGLGIFFTFPKQELLSYPVGTSTESAYPPPVSATPVAEGDLSTIEAPLYLGHWIGTVSFATPATVTPWPTPTPHPYTPAVEPRHGVGASWFGPAAEVYRGYLGNWANMWSSNPPNTPPAPPGQSTNQFEYAPMMAGGPLRLHFMPTHASLLSFDNETPHDYWLVFNECEHNWQCDSTPQEAAVFFHDEVLRQVYEWGGDPNAQLIIGGANAHPCGMAWLTEFVHAYQIRYRTPLPHAGWHFHLYPEVSPNGWHPDGTFDATRCDSDWVYNVDLFGVTIETATAIPPFPTPNMPSLWPYWEEQAEDIYRFWLAFGQQGDELWITEMGCIFGNWPGIPSTPPATPLPGCNTSGYMYQYVSRITAWLNNEGRWIDRYSWFADWHWKDVEYQTSLFAMTPTVVPPMTPTPTPSPGPSPTPTATVWPAPTATYFPPNLSSVGAFYRAITPAAPVPKPTTIFELFFPVFADPY